MEDKKDKSLVFKKKEYQRVEVNADVEVAKLIEDDLRTAIDMVIQDASKKYFRNIAVEFAVNIK